MRPYFLILALSILTVACQSQNVESTEIRQQLFREFGRQAPLLRFVDQYPQAVIVKNDQCGGPDCRDQLVNAGIEIPVYSREDAFMRKLDRMIVIQELTLSGPKPQLTYVLYPEDKPQQVYTVTL